jgi:penicillin-binding protein 2
MPQSILRKIRKRFSRGYRDIDPEDIFLDSANLPGFDTDRMQGRIEKPVGSSTFLAFKIVLGVCLVLLVGKLIELQMFKGSVYAEISENNRLEHTLIFANRGIIYDRNGVELATNGMRDSDTDFSARVYPDIKGLSTVVGYVKYPARDSRGRYYDPTYKGISGVEKIYDDALTGKNGLKITETNARGGLISESSLEKPEDGKPLYVSLDARITEEMYKAIKDTAEARGFTGGAGAIMDVETGEIIALTSYPDYDQNLMTEGEDRKSIASLLNDPRTPLLNRVVSGLYTPGSIVKPIMAIAALDLGTISPEKQILSTGALTLPNPYDPAHPTVFKDWKAHGLVDMRRAIAVSSDVYFYVVGGGFKDQKGIGIDNIDKYFTMFGMTTKTGIDLPGETYGQIASIAWKEKNFPGDPWRIGNTYHTSIGQYGTQVTPIEALRWVAAISNGGKMLIPSVLMGGRPEDERISSLLEFSDSEWRIIREGMRQGVESGAVTGLNSSAVDIAAKTGTAELGARKQYVNSWVTGFFPYEHPRYAFVIIMEKGPVTNLVGAVSVMRQVVDWMGIYTPEYFK